MRGVDFRDCRTPETRFPRTSLLGNSVNKGMKKGRHSSLARALGRTRHLRKLGLRT
jgi:hypothetical protein